jgi:hypothetical protein
MTGQPPVQEDGVRACDSIMALWCSAESHSTNESDSLAGQSELVEGE